MWFSLIAVVLPVLVPVVAFKIMHVRMDADLPTLIGP
jgi:hypothetical protein